MPALTQPSRRTTREVRAAAAHRRQPRGRLWLSPAQPHPHRSPLFLPPLRAVLVKETAADMANKMGKPETAAYLTSLSSTVDAVRFAAKMKKNKGPAAAATSAA